MTPHLKSISLGTVLALALAGASAQTPAPAGTASAPATLGVTPQEAATATQQAVPRSDTGTVVRTAPSAADRASAAMGANTPDTSNATGSTAQGTASMNGTAGTGSGAMGGTRPARADRN